MWNISRAGASYGTSDSDVFTNRVGSFMYNCRGVLSAWRDAGQTTVYAASSKCQQANMNLGKTRMRITDDVQ